MTTVPVGNRLGLGQALRGVLAICGREVGAIFDSKIAYVYAIAFALLANSIFMNEFFLAGRADMSPFFDVLPLLLCVFLPAVTMRSWAEESKSRTIELLLTLPIRPGQAVLAKFLASYLLFCVFLACSSPIPLMLTALGDPDPGRIAGGYLAALGLGALLLAVGSFCSALSADQIVAFVLATLAGFALVLSGDERVVATLDGLAEGLAPGTWIYESLSALPAYEELARGVVSLASVLYFALGTLVFLGATAFLLARNRS